MKTLLVIVVIFLLAIFVSVTRPRKLPEAAPPQTNVPVVHWLHIQLGTNSTVQTVAIGLKEDGSVTWSLPQ